MKIDSFNIKKLYGKWTLKGSLHSDVNIISGINGSFKSTLLRILRDQLQGNKDKAAQYEQAEINFTDNVRLYYRHFEDSLLSLKRAQKDELLEELASQIQTDLNDANEKVLSERILKADITAYKKDGKKLSIKDFKQAMHVDYISTFDRAHIDPNNVKDDLDEQLEKLEKDYAYYLSDLAQKAKSLFEGNETQNVVEEFGKIYSSNNTFLDIIDQCFADTQKKINRQRSELKFIFGDGWLTTKQLSSGEKQLLIVLLTVLLEREHEYILLMDEPEISMHYSWQGGLINYIQRLNPNCQIIMTSHSPGVIMEGWENYTYGMNDFTQEAK